MPKPKKPTLLKKKAKPTGKAKTVSSMKKWIENDNKRKKENKKREDAWKKELKEYDSLSGKISGL